MSVPLFVCRLITWDFSFFCRSPHESSGATATNTHSTIVRVFVFEKSYTFRIFLASRRAIEDFIVLLEYHILVYKYVLEAVEIMLRQIRFL